MEFETNFDPYAILQKLQEASLHMANAFAEQQQLNHVTQRRIDNLLVIVQNQQQMIDILNTRLQRIESAEPINK